MAKNHIYFRCGFFVFYKNNQLFFLVVVNHEHCKNEFLKHFLSYLVVTKVVGLRLTCINQQTNIMKYLSTVQNLERGILTSSYKQEIRNSIHLEKKKSISNIKTLITNHHSNIESQTATFLRVSIFVIAVILFSS